MTVFTKVPGDRLSASTPAGFVPEVWFTLGTKALAASTITGTTVLPDASLSLSFGLRDLHLEFLVSNTYQEDSNRSE